MVRDITVKARSEEHSEAIVKAIQSIPDVEVISALDNTFQMHQGGKIQMAGRISINNADELAMAYTPGVARVCLAIHKDPKRVWELTSRKNTVAIVTDGTAVLGLCNIGPKAALPVMEGKALIFKEMAKVDAWPICIESQDADEIVEIVKNISPCFGGVNLEDISAPRCFYIEDRLRNEMEIPVFHDDQHGTAVVVQAALFNALHLVDKKMEELKVVILGAGAGGITTAKLIMLSGVKNVIGYDRTGAIYRGREYKGNAAKEWFAQHTNPDNVKGDLMEAMKGADLFIGLSGPGLLTVEHIKNMASNPMVFAMANPIPEILPEEAKPYVRIMATGRSDYPNQINNSLCFPGLFRGVLDVGAREINDEMKVAAAKAIASAVPSAELSEEFIIPSMFNPEVPKAVAAAVANAARETEVSRL